MLHVVETDAADDGHVFLAQQRPQLLDMDLFALCQSADGGGGALELDGPEVALGQAVGELLVARDAGLAKGLAAIVVGEADEAGPAGGGHGDAGCGGGVRCEAEAGRARDGGGGSEHEPEGGIVKLSYDLRC